MPGTIPATIEAAAAATLADARICAVSCNDGAQVGVDTSNDMPALEVAPGLAPLRQVAGNQCRPNGLSKGLKQPGAGFKSTCHASRQSNAGMAH